MKNKDRWSDLSISEKDALIKLYVSNGITSLDVIKKDYNSFDDGGDKNTTSSQQNVNPFVVPMSVPSAYSQKLLEDAKEAVAFKYRNYSEEELREHIRNVRAGIETEFTYPDGTVVFRTKDSPIKPEYPTDFTGLGDAVEAYNALQEAKRGNYKMAALSASLLLLPNFLGDIFKKGKNMASKTTRRVGPEVDVQNAGYINSIDDVTLDPYARTELPEEAFIPKSNPVDEVKQTVAVTDSQLQGELKAVYNNQKVQAILNRQDVPDFNLNPNIAANTAPELDLDKLRNMLIKEGVKPDLLTDDNLKKLIAARYADYTSNVTGNIALRNNILLNHPTQPHVYQYTQFRPEGNVGYTYIYDNTALGNKVGMVENTTSGVNRARGVSEQAYNSVIGDLGDMASGELLLDADATMHVLSKYPDKTVISAGTGNHWYKTGHEYGDIVRLNTPTYEVPVKYIDEFGLEGVSPEGNFIIDFDKGPTYKNGGSLNIFDEGGDKSVDGGTLPPAIITQDEEFNKFLMTLPENQRQTPESKYYTYKMWKIAGKPKDFNQAVDMGLYHWNDTDKSYHGNSVIYDEESDVYHFLKPKDHSTVQYELDWYNNGVTTDDNGNQYELAGDSKAEWEEFRRNYYLDSSGDDYVYRRRPTLGVSKQSRDSIMAALENGVKAALQNKISSINQSLQESKVNKFGTGGDTNGDNNNNSTTPTERKLTLEEFLQAKADSTRVAALENSRNRTEGVEIVYPLSEENKHNNIYVLEEYYFANPEFVGPVLAKQRDPYYRSRWYQANKELENNCDYGLNCIGTATDNYPEDSRTNVNRDFRMNASEYGFVGIPYEEMLPGDIVQVGEHGMIFDSFNGSTPTFNYSDGHIGPDAYKKQGKYPSNRYSVFRYVGTPGLIQQWTEEYNAQNKKLGGIINRFDDGGPTKTEQVNVSEIPIEFKWGVMDSPFWTYSPEPAPIEPEIPYAHNYMSEDDVYKELNSIMSSTRDPKELPGKLDTFLRSQIVGNPNIKYYRDGLIADINHYIKYPYSSIIIHRNNQDRDRLHRATIDGHIPLVEQSRVVLTNAGKSTGIELSTNMLDTLAYKGGIAGAELNRLLGVPAQETGFGKFPGTTYIKPEDITALDDEHDFYGVSRSNFINNYGVNPTELMNNHYYYTNSADQATIGAIARKYGVGHDASGGWADAYIGYNEVTPEVEQAFKDAYWHSTRQRDKEDIFVDPIVQAYELDATGNYNSKMKGHNELVEQRGIELWKSPEIQKWWEETGKAWYEKGLSERRLRIEGENNSK